MFHITQAFLYHHPLQTTSKAYDSCVMQRKNDSQSNLTNLDQGEEGEAVLKDKGLLWTNMRCGEAEESGGQGRKVR